MKYIDSSTSESKERDCSAYGMGIFALLFDSRRRKKLTRAQRKKLARRRYRIFVDKIVMHHKRIHDLNREKVLNLAKARVNSRIVKLERPNSRPSLSPEESYRRFKSASAKENRGEGRTNEMRKRIKAKKLRAISRWSVIEAKTSSENNTQEEVLPPPPMFNQ